MTHPLIGIIRLGRSGDPGANQPFVWPDDMRDVTILSQPPISPDELEAILPRPVEGGGELRMVQNDQEAIA